MDCKIVFDEEKLREIVAGRVVKIKKQFVAKDKIEAALTEITDSIEPEYITDSSGDVHGYMTDYERGLSDAVQTIYKHIGEDLKA